MKSLELLKENILNNELDNGFKIFKYEDNSFLVNTYINAICENCNLELNYVDSVEKLLSLKDDIFFDTTTYLNVVDVDELENNIVNFDGLENCIIKCKKIKKDLENNFTDYIYFFPKLTDWQITMYAEERLKGMDPKAIKWLCEITNYNILRLENEIDKIAVFDEKDRMRIFLLINKENGYMDLCNFTVFDLINAITKKKYDSVNQILKVIDLIDVEPVGLVTLLLRQFKNIIDIQMSVNPTPEKLGLTFNQFKAIKYNCGKYSNEKLIEIYELLNSIDYRLKAGLLDSDKIIDYIICNILK